MSLNGFVKKVQDIMRVDNGINGDAQRIEQMTWLLFLKVYDTKEYDWEFHDPNYQSVIPEELRWRNWAVDNKDGNALTGEDLLDFVNNKLFSTFKKLPLDESAPIKQRIVKAIFEDINQYMKDGIQLRKVINVIDDINFEDAKEKHAFGDIYETVLKDLQSAGNAGEFYTPRAVTDFMVQMIKPKLGEKIADFACGTGGFLTSALKELEKQVVTANDKRLYDESVFGIEKKPLPYLLAITNLLIHDIESPKIIHGNSLERDVRTYKEDEKFDVILMNPPYGGSENESIKVNFPTDLRSSETADLFMAVIMYRLKRNGRAAIVLPDGFLFGEDSAKIALKKKLLNEFNLHTIIRLPKSVFAPYTSITTNILFFDNTKKTESIWYYRVDLPANYKAFSKTKPMLLKHFKKAISWWDNRIEIIDSDTDTFKSKEYKVNEIVDRNYDLDLCSYPNYEEEILTPEETIRQYKYKKEKLSKIIEEKLLQIEEILKEK